MASVHKLMGYENGGFSERIPLAGGLSPVHLIHVRLIPVRLTRNMFGSFRLKCQTQFFYCSI